MKADLNSSALGSLPPSSALGEKLLGALVPAISIEDFWIIIAIVINVIIFVIFVNIVIFSIFTLKASPFLDDAFALAPKLG